MTDEKDNGEGEDFPLSDPGPTADDIVGYNVDQLFAIGMGEEECDDDRVRREAQTFVSTYMRSQGHSYQMIANEMKCSIGWCHRLVQRGLKRIYKKTQESAETIRQLQLERLNKMLAGVMERAETGDSFAIQSALQVMDRIDKAWGLEPPKRVEHTFTEDARNEALDQLSKNIAALAHERTDQDGSGDPPDRLN